MFKINMVLSDMLMHFLINMGGVRDSVENYKSYLVAICAVMAFESYEIFFFFVLSFVFRSLS